MKKKMITLLYVTVMATCLAGCAEQKNAGSDIGAQKNDTQTETQAESEATESEQAIDTEQVKADAQAETEADPDTEKQSIGKVSVAYEQVDEENYAKDNTTLLINSNYQRPTVTIEGNTTAADAINRSMAAQEQVYTTERDAMKAEAEAAYVNATAFNAYWLSFTFETQRVDSHVVAMRQMKNIYKEDANGEQNYSGYNYDTKTGKELTLETIATDKDMLIDSAENYILAQLQQPYYADKLLVQGEANKDTLTKSVVIDGNWFFADAGITFIANTDILAANTAGTWYFTVPYDKMEGLKAEYHYDPLEMAWQITAPLGVPLSADLNGDGTEDNVLYNVTANEDGSDLAVTFTINDVDYSGKINHDEVYITDGATWTAGYYVVDIDKNDSFKEIALMDNGASDDFVTYFFRFTGQEVVYLGYVNDLLSYSSCRANGDGTITANCRLDILETANFVGTYEIGNEGKIELRKQDMYDIDRSYASKEYTSHNILKDVTVYTKADQSSEKKTLTTADGPVTFTKTDNEHWAELVTASGDAYYLYLTDYITLETGEDAQTIFENLPLAD